MCRIVEAETKVQRLNSLLTHVLACSHASLNLQTCNTPISADFLNVPRAALWLPFFTAYVLNGIGAETASAGNSPRPDHRDSLLPHLLIPFPVTHPSLATPTSRNSAGGCLEHPAPIEFGHFFARAPPPPPLPFTFQNITPLLPSSLPCGEASLHHS